MGIKGMLSLNASALGILIAINLVLSMTPEMLWIAVAAFALVASMAFCFRQGAALGHGACSIGSTVESARRAGDKVYSQLDRAYLAQAWDRGTGLRALLASAIVPYAAGCIYIVVSMLWPGQEIVLPFRVAAWVLSLPYWPILMHWHESFVALTPDIAAMLMITPFILPACTYFGYLQGPRLWARSEEAMKQGRRRAKARSRVAQKRTPQQDRPEI